MDKQEATAYGRGFFFAITLHSGPGALPDGLACALRAWFWSAD